MTGDLAALVALVGFLSLPSEGLAQSTQMPPLPERLREEARQLVGTDAEVCDVAQVRSREVPGLFLASVDTSGRKFCNEVLVVRAGTSPRAIASIETWWLNDVSDAVRDLDGDSDDEIVVPQQLTSYEGAGGCVATIPVVFKCSADDCADLSQQFASFYLAELDRASRQLTEQRSKPSNSELGDVPCLQVRIAKLDRMLGNDPSAGLALAKEWTNSDDVSLRKKAVSILDDIASPEASSQLGVLAGDEDAAVAGMARRSLAKRDPPQG